jgi:hypothetical protein
MSKKSNTQQDPAAFAQLTKELFESVDAPPNVVKEQTQAAYDCAIRRSDRRTQN